MSLSKILFTIGRVCWVLGKGGEKVQLPKNQLFKMAMKDNPPSIFVFKIYPLSGQIKTSRDKLQTFYEPMSEEIKNIIINIIEVVYLPM